MKNEHVKISRYLSYILRHKPESIGIELQKDGWIDIDILIEASNKNGHNMTREDLCDVVRTNDKQRFKISEDGLRIRASQGHSRQIELGLKPVEPPEFLFHGTIDRFLEAIFKEGLKKMNRQHVHLSQDCKTATSVGARRGKPVILKIKSMQMHVDGFKFFLSDNGVWLTDNVPPEYIMRES